MWTGTWHSAKVEGAGAHYFWNAEGCDIITQHSDTTEPQLVYQAYGGSGIGYNSDMREVVGDSVLSAPMLQWGPVYKDFVSKILTNTWVEGSQAWPGAAEGAVKLMPTFSPRVDPATVQFVEQEHDKLKAAKGDDALHHIFCGPLLKRWAYDFAAGSSGPRASGCGFQPVWRRLEPPEQINLKHYRDADGNPLPASRAVPLDTDCIFGLFWPGQALLQTAYPTGDFSEDLVFSDYMIEGVELLQPRTNEWGTVYDEKTHGCSTSYGTTGDRFFSPPPDPWYPTTATDCGSGTYLKIGSEPALTVCENCPPGKYEVMHLYCALAEAGFYADTYGNNRSGLLPCKPNSQAQVFFQVSPTETALQLTTGATNSSHCLCKAGFFIDAGECVKCPDEAECHGANFPPVAKKGYGQITTNGKNNGGKNFFKCPNFQECVVDSDACDCLGGSVNMTTLETTPFECSVEGGYAHGANLCGKCDASQGFALQGRLCVECTLGNSDNGGGVAYVALAIIVVLCWFPILRDLITKRFRSMYTTTSFLQYLGVYSGFDIPWRNGLRETFVGLGFFNLSFNAMHLECALSWEVVWLLQELLPLFYPLVVIMLLPVQYAWATCQGREWSVAKALQDAVGPGLFYINMYYYNGISNSLDMLNCQGDGEGSSYLLQQPEVTCWSSFHTSYAIISVFGLIIYMVLIPLYYCYVFFVKIPKKGLQDRSNVETYGFLYERFLPECYYWELIELGRKFAFVLISKIGQRMIMTEALYVALICCTLVLWAELSRHPFKSAAYDFVEEFTTLTEVALLLNGLVVFSRKNDGSESLDWLETVVWIFLGASFLLVLAITLVDLGLHLRLRWVSKVRAAKQLMLSPAIFDLQMSQYLLPRWVEQAGPDELRALKAVEDCMGRLVQKGLLVHSAANKYDNMLKLAPTALDYVIEEGGGTNPHTAKGLLDPHFISKVMTKCPPSEGNEFGLERGASSEELLHQSDSVGSQDILEVRVYLVPSAFLFNDLVLGSVLSFYDQKASPQEIQDCATLFAAVQKFEAQERSAAKTHSLLEKAQQMISELGLLKHVHAKNKLLASILAVTKQQGREKKKLPDFKVRCERAIAAHPTTLVVLESSTLTDPGFLTQISLESEGFGSTTEGVSSTRPSFRRVSSYLVSARPALESGMPDNASGESPKKLHEPAYPVSQRKPEFVGTLLRVIRPARSTP